MKITPDSYKLIVEAFKKIKQKHPTVTPAHYAANKIGKDSNMRFRWDAFRVTKIGVMEFYSQGLNDNHIDTALRKAVKEVWG